MSRRGAWVARFLLVATSIAVSLLCGEFVVARIAPQDLSIWDNTRDGMTVHRAHADAYLPSYQQRIRTNNLGMRDRDRSVDPASGDTRVLVLGDSFMEALQVPYEDSFPRAAGKDC